jgi:hypothetical protein
MPKPDNLYDALKVEEIGLYKGPDGGGALIVQFKQTVEIDGKGFAFPLSVAQVTRLFKLLSGHVSEWQLAKIPEPRLVHEYKAPVISLPSAGKRQK